MVVSPPTKAGKFSDDLLASKYFVAPAAAVNVAEDDACLIAVWVFAKYQLL